VHLLVQRVSYSAGGYYGWWLAEHVVHYLALCGGLTLQT
jgi:hypothetical protein